MMRGQSRDSNSNNSNNADGDAGTVQSVSTEAPASFPRVSSASYQSKPTEHASMNEYSVGINPVTSSTPSASTPIHHRRSSLASASISHQPTQRQTNSPLSNSTSKSQRPSSAAPPTSSSLNKQPQEKTRIGNNWESVATSWLLPDSAQVVWRLALATGLITTYIVTLADDPSSIHSFSINAYRISILTSLLLTVPGIASLSCFANNGEALDNTVWHAVWTIITTSLVFSISFILTITTGYTCQLPSNERQWKHAITLVAWLTAEIIVGTTRITLLNVVCALFVWVVYITICVLTFTDQALPWLQAYLSVGRIVGTCAAVACFAFYAAAVMGVVTLRLRFANYSNRRRGEHVTPPSDEIASSNDSIRRHTSLLSVSSPYFGRHPGGPSQVDV